MPCSRWKSRLIKVLRPLVWRGVHGDTGPAVAFAAHIEHRNNIKTSLDSRRAIRRSRRPERHAIANQDFLTEPNLKDGYTSLVSKAENM